MGSKEKLIKRFKTIPKDFTWDELKSMLTSLGYSLCNKGRTSGSRVIYECEGRKSLLLHKPHQGNIMKEYILKEIYKTLAEEELI